MSVLFGYLYEFMTLCAFDLHILHDHKLSRCKMFNRNFFVKKTKTDDETLYNIILQKLQPQFSHQSRRIFNNACTVYLLLYNIL